MSEGRTEDGGGRKGGIRTLLHQMGQGKKNGASFLNLGFNKIIMPQISSSECLSLLQKRCRKKGARGRKKDDGKNPKYPTLTKHKHDVFLTWVMKP